LVKNLVFVPQGTPTDLNKNLLFKFIGQFMFRNNFIQRTYYLDQNSYYRNYHISNKNSCYTGCCIEPDNILHHLWPTHGHYTSMNIKTKRENKKCLDHSKQQSITYR